MCTWVDDMMRTMVVVGTRPEVIKMAPVVKALQAHRHDFVFVHSGQHHDFNLSVQFIEELGLPPPDYSLSVRATFPAAQTGRMMITVEKVIRKAKPDLLLIEGDTNTMLAAALAGFKQDIPVGHVEAGLRSYDFRMPEEHNRRMVDHASTYLFAPTEKARRNLADENVWGKTYVTGNTIIDAITEHISLAEKKSTITGKLKFREYALATVHRTENVDDPLVLRNFVEAFVDSPVPIVFSVHPRTKKRLRQYGMWKELFISENLQLFPPLGYLDFLLLMRNCSFILTDSGGLQEEATAPSIRKPVLVMRLSTERPEAVEEGFAQVVGTRKEDILAAINRLSERGISLPSESPYGDGHAGERIVAILEEEKL